MQRLFSRAPGSPRAARSFSYRSPRSSLSPLLPVLGAAAPLIVLGCSGLGSSSQPTGRTGDLGHGKFAYQCVDDVQDAACAGGAEPSAFPSAVAVGGRFKLAYQPNGASSTVGNPSLKPVSIEFLSVLVDELQAIKPGLADVVVRASTDGKVIDFTAIHVSPVSAIAIVDSATQASEPVIKARMGAKVSLVVRAYDPRGEALAGLITAQWTPPPADNVVRVESSPGPSTPGNLVVFSAVGVGSTTLTATTIDKLTASVVIEVTS